MDSRSSKFGYRGKMDKGRDRGETLSPQKKWRLESEMRIFLAQLEGILPSSTTCVRTGGILFSAQMGGALPLQNRRLQGGDWGGFRFE